MPNDRNQDERGTHDAGSGADETGRALAMARALLDEIEDIMFSVAVPGYRLTWVNATGLAYFQAMRGVVDPIGKTPRELAHDSVRAELFEAFFARAITDGTCVADYRTPGDGRSWRLRFRAVHHLGTCVGVAVNAKELTELERARERLAESEGMYRSLFESMGVGAVFQTADGRIIAVNRAAEIIEGRTEDQMKGLTSDASDWDAVKNDGSPFPGDEHPSMVTIRTGKPQTDVVMGIRRPSGERRWLSINSQPVVVSGQDAPKAVVTTFHDITERRALESHLGATIRQLDTALEETLAAMSDMIEMRDPYTAGHERHVADIAVNIANALGWSPERCATLRQAALVHDIGKIGIPTEILVKPSRLTDLEYELIKEHADFGYRILSSIAFAHPIAEIVLQHHERLDGSGYPRGLEGDEILMEARVLAVADVAESMMSHRPYRPSLGVEAAIEELETHAGTLYDAEVVAAFRRTVDGAPGAGSKTDLPKSAAALPNA